MVIGQVMWATSRKKIGEKMVKVKWLNASCRKIVYKAVMIGYNITICIS